MSLGPLGNCMTWVAAPSPFFDDWTVQLVNFRSRSLRWYRPLDGYLPLTRSWREAAARWSGAAT